MKNVVLFCTGMSGSGKSYFINKYLSEYGFYKLKSATTRPMRAGERDGHEYFFVQEDFFDKEPLVTKLWVNQGVWTPGKPKWLYGVSVKEVLMHIGENLVYDVIEPKYVRQMLDWFKTHGLDKIYEARTLYFISSENSLDIVHNRANMSDDITVRKNNTCNPIDFLRADIPVDFMLKSNKTETVLPTNLVTYLRQLQSDYMSRSLSR